MGDRAVVVFKDKEVHEIAVYLHWDGYRVEELIRGAAPRMRAGDARRSTQSSACWPGRRIASGRSPSASASASPGTPGSSPRHSASSSARSPAPLPFREKSGAPRGHKLKPRHADRGASGCGIPSSVACKSVLPQYANRLYGTSAPLA